MQFVQALLRGPARARRPYRGSARTISWRPLLRCQKAHRTPRPGRPFPQRRDTRSFAARVGSRWCLVSGVSHLTELTHVPVVALPLSSCPGADRARALKSSQVLASSVASPLLSLTEQSVTLPSEATPRTKPTTPWHRSVAQRKDSRPKASSRPDCRPSAAQPVPPTPQERPGWPQIESLETAFAGGSAHKPLSLQSIPPVSC